MRHRLEEEPEPDEEPGEAPVAAAPAPMVPAVPGGGRDLEYRTELLTGAEVVDGSTLADRLTQASGEGWDLVDIVQAGESYVVLLRRPKAQDREDRRVGFLPPGR